MATYHESSAGLLLPRSSNGHQSLAESWAVAILESRIGELEARLQEQGWARLSDNAGREFSREAQARLVELARVAYLKNPIINRAVEIGALYVWGQNLSVSVPDEDAQAVLDRFWRENRATLTGQQASRLLEVELQVTGNVFLALFPDRITGDVRVRTVPMEEIHEIVANPEDRYDPWFYIRRWTQTDLDGKPTEMTACYPDWRYSQRARPATVRNVAVQWDTPLLHIKVGAYPHWQWGVSEVYAALDWATAYKATLEDDATRSKALARFAWNLTTTGGADAIAAAKAKLGSTLNTGGTWGPETNPPPVSGSTFIRTAGVDMQPMRIAGATLDPDHARPIRLMAASALGLPETFFGDADVGNHATAKTLDRPTELRYNERRQMWRDILTDLMQWVIDRDAEATRGILRGRQLDEEERAIELSWPDLLEQSVTERVDAVVRAATMAGLAPAGTISAETTSRLLLVALGVEDVDSELEKIEDERDAAAAAAAAAPPPPPPTANPAGEPEPEEEPEEEPPTEARRRSLTEAARAPRRQWRAWTKRTAPHETAIARVAREVFAAQERELVSGVQMAGVVREAGVDPNILIALQALIDDNATAEVIRPVLAEAMRQAGQAGLDELGLSIRFDVTDPNVQTWIESRSRAVSKQVNATTWHDLQRSLSDGLAAGEGTDTLASRVQAVMGGRQRMAETIARTEANAAMNGGTLMSWKQTGVVQKKRWLAARDERTRPTHVAADGQEVGIDEDFQVGGGSGPAPGQIGLAEEDVLCRCTMVAVVAEPEEMR